MPGVPALPFSLLLCYSLGLMGVITPYATGPAPVYYASGFISRADFWRLGLVFGLLSLGLLLAIGMPYLTLLHRGESGWPRLRSWWTTSLAWSSRGAGRSR